ncbi:uncharacterized protein LOC112574019 isoform X2 [Pomacea canaliculata]|uniref:uncharacterized protein LOC112574019 isoform X2 n=1 Tax=Pomacea canaliculata TaxID=400727 RepID=UPI000D732EA0|nr:uncharacterized protein LOC112574019 isoform X2 [Pomacea canaliculata]
MNTLEESAWLLVVAAMWGATNPLIKKGSKGVELIKEDSAFSQFLAEFQFLFFNIKIYLLLYHSLILSHSSLLPCLGGFLEKSQSHMKHCLAFSLWCVELFSVSTASPDTLGKVKMFIHIYCPYF